MAPSAGPTGAADRPESQPDRSSLAGNLGSSSGNPNASADATAAGNPPSAAALAKSDMASSIPHLDGILPDDGNSKGVANPNPNPSVRGVMGNKAPPHADQKKTAPRSYATIAANKALRPPPAFVTNLNTFHPVKRGAAVVLKMPEELYRKRLAAFNFALIGRIYLPKYTPPRALPDLKSELQVLFKTTQDWSLNPLGKGFYSLKFACQEDQFLASRFTSWRLKIGNFHMREWKPNFDPYKEQNSITQIWVRLFHLPEEYWDTDFLVGIFRAVGNVVKLDGSTAHGTVGHFARALVEVDLNYPLADSVTIECGGSSFLVEFGFENMPLFCSYCRYIGHAVADCKTRKRAEESKETADKPSAAAPKQKAAKQKEKAVVWQQKPDTLVTTSNSFAALDQPDNPESSEAAIPSNRELVPLSAEAAAALNSIKGRDYSNTNPEFENVYSSDDDDVVEHLLEETSKAIVAVMPHSHSPTAPSGLDFTAEGLETLSRRIASPPKAADPGNTSEPPVIAEGLELSPKGSASPLETTPTDKDETTLVVPPPAQVAGNKMSAAAKRRTKEALRKTRVKSSMKTRSRFDVSSDILHVLADKRGKSVQVPADSVGQTYGPHPKSQLAVKLPADTGVPKAANLEGNLRTALEQDMPPTAQVLDTGQSRVLKAMGLAAKQRWGDLLDFPDSDDDFYDLMS